MISGCLCGYYACDMDDITMCCKGSGECLCCVDEFCCAGGEDQFGCGCPEKKEGECIRCAMPCCAQAIKSPTTCASSAQSECCFYNVCSFPFQDDYVPQLVCAVYCLQCAPNGGCCKEPP